MSWERTSDRGSVLGMRFVLACLRLFGVRAARLVNEAPILWHFLFNARARAASREYLRRVAARPEGRASLGGEPGLWMTWRHLRTFGHGLLDRACFWAGMGDRFQVDFPARELFTELEKSKRGALLLGAHLGTIDVLRAAVARKSMVVNTLVFTKAARKFTSVLRSIDPRQAARIIEVDPGSIQCILDLTACIERGELVAMLGDRCELASDRRSAAAQFLGSEAVFPLGPYWLAHLLQCPVYLLFALKRGPYRYEVCLEPFVERILLDRNQPDPVLRECLERYVRRLEAQCLGAPLQWFNFYDFWRSESAPAGERHAAPATAEPGLGRGRARPT